MDNLQRAKEEAIARINSDIVYPIMFPDKSPEMITPKVVSDITDEIVTSTYLQAVNETLETQALALEGMKEEVIDDWDNYPENTWNEHYNNGLQRAADYLRAQKITE